MIFSVECTIAIEKVSNFPFRKAHARDMRSFSDDTRNIEQEYPLLRKHVAFKSRSHTMRIATKALQDRRWMFEVLRTESSWKKLMSELRQVEVAKFLFESDLSLLL